MSTNGGRRSTERRVCGEDYTLLFTVFLKLELWIEGVYLDLVGCGYDFGVSEEDVEVLDRKVGDANCFHFSCLVGKSVHFSSSTEGSN